MTRLEAFRALESIPMPKWWTAPKLVYRWRQADPAKVALRKPVNRLELVKEKRA